MRLLACIVVLAVGVVLSGCGGSSAGTEAGKAFGVASVGLTTAMGKTSREVLSGPARAAIADAMQKAVWAGYVHAVAEHARSTDRANYCDSFPTQKTTNASFDASTGTGTASCVAGCSGTPKVFSVTCTMGTNATIKATCKGVDYTASAGSFGLSFPDAPTTTTATSLTFTLSFSMTVSGGNLKAGGSAIVLSMDLNMGDLANAKDASSFCSAVKNFKATVDGSDVSCSSLADGVSACS